MANLIDHHIGQLRNNLDLVPNSREKSLALTKLDEFEMWAARCDTTSLVPRPEVNLKPVETSVVTVRYFLDAAANGNTWMLENGPDRDGYWVLKICKHGDIDKVTAIYLCNGQSESETERKAFQKFVTHHF